MKEKLKRIYNYLRSIVINPHLLICMAIAWIITNGWAYVAVGIGTFYDIHWLAVVGGSYLAILWSPLCVEGILTVIIAMFLMKKLFPNDKNALDKIMSYYNRYKKKIVDAAEKRQAKKAKRKGA